MAQYTIEDIEIIRQKSGISYEEAVNLLEYHNGSLARALVDLEKNGRIRDARRTNHNGGKKSKRLFTSLYRTRVKVTRDQLVIANISILFVILAFLLAFWVPAIGFILALVMGYRISMERNSRDFMDDSFESIVQKASTNVKSTVSAFARDLEKAASGQDAPMDAPADKDEPRAESAASGTTPVNVQFPDGGSVEVREDTDGFHEADIQ